MDDFSNQEKLKGILYYLPKAVKFYELKNEKLTRIVFVIILFTVFASGLIPSGSSDSFRFRDIVVNSVTIAIVYLASTVYLTAFIRELKGKEYTGRECFHRVAKKASRIVLASLLYGAGVVLGLLAFIIPGLIIMAVFSFYICYIVDLGESVQDSFQASRRITRRYRKKLFTVISAFYIVLLFAGFLLVSIAASSGSSLAVSFAMTFVSAVVSLMYQRLIALLYMDLEYPELQNRRE